MDPINMLYNLNLYSCMLNIYIFQPWQPLETVALSRAVKMSSFNPVIPFQEVIIKK